MRYIPSLKWRSCALTVFLASTASLWAQSDVTQPGDPVIASSSNSPGSEGVANAIDNQQTKYLNFDSRTPNNPPSGFVVTPSIGASTVIGISILTANDAPARDPKDVRLEGSNDDTIASYRTGTWALSTAATPPAATTRLLRPAASFWYPRGYAHYRCRPRSPPTPTASGMQGA